MSGHGVQGGHIQYRLPGTTSTTSTVSHSFVHLPIGQTAPHAALPLVFNMRTTAFVLALLAALAAASPGRRPHHHQPPHHPYESVCTVTKYTS